MIGFCLLPLIRQGFSMHERERQTEILRIRTLGSGWLLLIFDLYETKALVEMDPQTSEVCGKKTSPK